MSKANLRLKTLLGPSLLAIFFSLSACTTKSIYAPQSSDKTDGKVGYSSEQLMNNRYKVSFSGDEFTRRERLEKLLLYRAAELTQQKGYDSFKVIQDNTVASVSTEVDTVPAPGAVRAYPHFSPYYNFYGPTFGARLYNPYLGKPFMAERYIIDQSERFDASAVIEMYREQYQPNSEQTFDASEVIARIGPIKEPTE